MQLRNRTFSAASSFLSSLFGVWITYRYAEGIGTVVVTCAFYIVGILLGCANGLLFGRNSAKTIGYAALFAVLLLWTPVVLATYGFALIAIPLVIAYAACVYFGADFVTKRED
jgi:tetrahydromethanopterin S-methyltransferase subunit F